MVRRRLRPLREDIRRRCSCARPRASVTAAPPSASRTQRRVQARAGLCQGPASWVIFPRTVLSEPSEDRSAQRPRWAMHLSGYRPSTSWTRPGPAAGGIADAAASATPIRPGGAGAAARRRQLLKVGTPYPLPGESWLCLPGGAWTRCWCVEELDPVLERALVYLCGKHHLPTVSPGQADTGDMSSRRRKHRGIAWQRPSPPSWALPCRRARQRETPPPLPVRPPVLCAGCPHRGSFYAVKVAMKGRKAVLLRGHRLLYAGQRHAAGHGGHLPVHGRGRHHRPGPAPGGAGRGELRLHRGFHLLPHGDSRRGQRRLQRAPTSC